MDNAELDDCSDQLFLGMDKIHSIRAKTIELDPDERSREGVLGTDRIQSALSLPTSSQRHPERTGTLHPYQGTNTVINQSVTVKWRYVDVQDLHTHRSR